LGGGLDKTLGYLFGYLFGFIFWSKKYFCLFFCFELSVIPIVFIIIGWGLSPERVQATVFFVLYTLLSGYLFFSVLWSFPRIKFNFLRLLFFKFSFFLKLIINIPFLVKLPLLWFHFWLPKAHVEASAIGSILLARVLLKIGGYGLFLFSSFCFGFYKIGCLFLLFCLIGAFLVLLQRDIKKIIAFTSIFHILSFLFLTWAHVNFSCFGGLFMLFIHRVLSAFFFIVVREVYYLTFTRNFFFSFFCIIKIKWNFVVFIIIIINI